MARTPCCKAEGLKKGAWTPEEDQKLIAYINEHGEGGWRTLPEKAGLKRCGKSCRLRWANYLRPDIKRGEFSQEEEATIIRLHSIHGNKWSAIARRLHGRTDNEIKNYWNTHVKKRLIKKGIDPISHKPLSKKSDCKSDLNAEKDGLKIAENDRTEEDMEHKKPPLSLSAKFLNKVANKFARKVNQFVLTEIIEGSGGPPSDHIHGNQRSANSSTSASNLLNKMNQTSSDSPVSITNPFTCCLVTTVMEDDFHGVSSGTGYNDTEFSRFLESISNDDDFMGDDSNDSGAGFVDQLMYETDMVVVNEGDSCKKVTFEDIESYWDEYMGIDNY